MDYRRTNGIVTDAASSDPGKEADVIMTAAALGLAGDYIAKTGKPIQFDIDPLDRQSTDPREQETVKRSHDTVPRMDAAVAAYLAKKSIAPHGVHAGVTPGWAPGVLILDALTIHDAELNRINRTLP